MTNKNGYQTMSVAKARGGKELLAALALAGAVFQGCNNEDASPAAVGKDPAAEDATGSYDYSNPEAKARYSSFSIDSASQAADETTADSAGGSPGDLVLTPFGQVERRCIYQLRPGEVLQDENTVQTVTGLRKLAEQPECGASAALRKGAATAKTDGWVMSAWWKLGFVGYEIWSDLKVPKDPSHKGNQVLFLFSSFEDENMQWIVQPVLQYGYGGKYWSMASWIVGPNGKVFRSKDVKVYAGDKLWGYTHATNCKRDGRCAWTIDMLDLTRHTSTQLKSDVRLPPMKYAQGGVMEAYGLNRCDEYPNQARVDFTGIAVYDGKQVRHTSKWTENLDPQKPDCRFDVTMRQGETSSVGLHWKTNL